MNPFFIEKQFIEILSWPIKIQNDYLTKLLNTYYENQKINIDIRLNLELKALIERANLGNLTGHDYHILSKNFWVIPFELDYKNIKQFDELSSIKFKQEMLKYFNNNRIRRLFNTCILLEKEKSKKTLLKQIEKNYFLKNFAVCSTCLITYLDGLSLSLIDKTSNNQHYSREVFKSIEKMYDEDIPKYNGGYEIYIKLRLILDFYNKIYKSYDLKSPNTENANRHLTSHGSYYSNKKIETIWLLNSIWFIQDTLKLINLEERFHMNNKNNIIFKEKE